MCICLRQLAGVVGYGSLISIEKSSVISAAIVECGGRVTVGRGSQLPLMSCADISARENGNSRHWVPFVFILQLEVYLPFSYREEDLMQ